MDWSWRSLLNSEPWTRSIAIRFRSSRGSLSIDVTTGSSYLNERFDGVEVKQVSVWNSSLASVENCVWNAQFDFCFTVLDLDGLLRFRFLASEYDAVRSEDNFK